LRLFSQWGRSVVLGFGGETFGFSCEV